jgi:hypothetical protein
MNTSYTNESIARQRMDETARQARTAYQRHEIKARTRWHFPKVTWPARPGTFTPRPA